MSARGRHDRDLLQEAVIQDARGDHRVKASEGMRHILDALSRADAQLGRLQVDRMAAELCRTRNSMEMAAVQTGRPSGSTCNLPSWAWHAREASRMCTDNPRLLSLDHRRARVRARPAEQMAAVNARAGAEHLWHPLSSAGARRPADDQVAGRPPGRSARRLHRRRQ